MKLHLIAAVFSLVVMVPLDALWITVVAKSFYARMIGHLFAATPSLAPAVLFYVLYASVLGVLVVVPAVEGGWSLGKVYLYGVALGLAAYGAYDFTNQATLRDWPVVMTVVDLAWGACVTGLVAVAATALTRYVS